MKTDEYETVRKLICQAHGIGDSCEFCPLYDADNCYEHSVNSEKVLLAFLGRRQAEDGEAEKELEAIEKSDAKDDCCEKKMEDKAKEDKVNHPRHYDLPGGGQAIDVIEDMLDDTENEGYYKGNIIKYIARYKKKGGAESLKKARWYLDKLIALKEVQEEMSEGRA